MECRQLALACGFGGGTILLYIDTGTVHDIPYLEQPGLNAGDVRCCQFFSLVSLVGTLQQNFNI